MNEIDKISIEEYLSKQPEETPAEAPEPEPILKSPPRVRKAGVISALFISRGYGFIDPDNQDEPMIFFHATGILNNTIEKMRVGDQVGYIVVAGKYGRLAAAHVTTQTREEY